MRIYSRTSLRLVHSFPQSVDASEVCYLSYVLDTTDAPIPPDHPMDCSIMGRITGQPVLTSSLDDPGTIDWNSLGADVPSSGLQAVLSVHEDAVTDGDKIYGDDGNDGNDGDDGNEESEASEESDDETDPGPVFGRPGWCFTACHYTPTDLVCATRNGQLIIVRNYKQVLQGHRSDRQLARRWARNTIVIEIGFPIEFLAVHDTRVTFSTVSFPLSSSVVLHVQGDDSLTK